jgi:hypothetical protein
MQIELRSDATVELFERKSRAAAQCRGGELESKLLEYNLGGGQECRVPHYGTGIRRFIAPYDQNLYLTITCQDYPIPEIDCDLQFPFRSFSVSLRFNHGQLPKWREVVETAIDFLKSKEYR